MEKKIEAHCEGIGVGWLPIHRITSELATNKLVALPLKDHANRHHDLYIAWGKNNKGKALAWFVEQLKKMDTSELYRVD
jgi:DNA-binding transcriptional LysR family regulator